MNLQDRKGITLVALAVTITVLIILATISINGIIGENGLAEQAKKIEKIQEDKISNREAQTNELEGKYENTMTSTTIPSNPSTGPNGKTLVTVLTARQTNTVIAEDELGKQVVVPADFKVRADLAKKVDEGIVIEDKLGNQFVWVPVATIADYKRTWYTGWGSFSEYLETLPEDEKTSVERYKGFYIGRYEAGDKENTEAKTLRSSNDVTKTVTIKANQAPYNYVTRTQAKSLAEGFKTQQNYSSTIKTKLVSSYAWDTAIAFLQKVNSDYGSSSEEGNYTDTTFSYTDITGATKTKAKNSSVLVPTGQTTPVCNIYDMGGNVWEWTTETFSNSSLSTFTECGGGYGSSYSDCSAGYRDGGTNEISDKRRF